jgi:iron complex outermembrane receptor protein
VGQGVRSLVSRCSRAGVGRRAVRCARLVFAFFVASTSASAGEPTVLPPSVLEEVAAPFPDDVQQEGISGDVSVDVQLDVEGRVVRVVVQQSPDARLSWSAMGALAGFRFQPARLRYDDGREVPIPVRFTYTMGFALAPAPPPPAPAADAVAAAPDEPAVLRGTVHATGDEAAIAGAHVHVHKKGEDVIVAGVVVEAVTDGHGGFELAQLPPGPLDLLVDAPGYVSVRAAVDVVAGSRQDILVHLDPVPVEHRQTVVVGRARREVVARTLTQSVAVVDGATLARVRGRALADAVAEVPGVTMVQAGPQQAKPVVRGLFGRRLVMLTDGVRHESQDWGLDHAPEIDPHAAGQITVVKGAAGVRYGADAVGGVILTEPPALRLDPGLDGEIYVGGVDNGLRGEVGGRVDLVLPQAPAFSLRIEGNTSRGAAQSTPDYVLGNTGNAVDNVGFTLGHRSFVFERAVTATLTFRHHDSEVGICYCLEVATPEALQERLRAGRPPGADRWTTSYAIDRPRQRVKHSLALARVDVDVDVGHLQAGYAFQLDDRDEFDQVRRVVDGPQYSFLLTTHAVDVVFAHKRQHVGRFALHGQVGARGDAQLHAYEGLQLIPNYRRFSGGVFGLERLVAQDVGGIGDLEFVAGVRADGLAQTSFLDERAWRTQIRRGRLTADDCDVVDDVARCDKNLPAASVTLGSRLTMPISPDGGADRLSLQVDLSSASRFPDVDELYLGGRAPSFPVFGLGDAGLGTERTWQLSVGSELKTAWVLVEAGAFASRIEDYIAFAPEPGPDGRPIVDVLVTGAYPRFSSRAVEAVMSGADGGAVLLPDALFSVAVQGAVVRGLDLTGGGYLPFLPPDQLRVELRCQPDDDVLGLLSATLAQRVRATRLATGLVAVATQTRSDSRSDFAPPPPGYTLWNASASTEIDAFGTVVQVGLEGRNLLDARYRNPMSLLRFFADQPGREVWLRIAVRFDDVFTDHDHDSHQPIDDTALPHGP